MAEIECTLVLLISFLSLHHILVEGKPLHTSASVLAMK